MARSHYRVIEWLCIYDQTVNGPRALQADDEGLLVGTAGPWERPLGGQGPPCEGTCKCAGVECYAQQYMPTQLGHACVQTHRHSYSVHKPQDAQPPACAHSSYMCKLQCSRLHTVHTHVKPLLQQVWRDGTFGGPRQNLCPLG